jgi:chromate transporter
MVEAPSSRKISVVEIFLAFLLIGATSFGGGVVAYLRASLVAKHRWIDDEKFLELLSISQTLPGLVATNMSLLVGDRLGGMFGGVVAMIGMCLPGALVMFAAGVLYGHHGGRPAVTAMLHGVAAAAVGLVLATTLQIGRRSLKHWVDLIFVALTLAGVHVLHQSLPRVLLAVGALAIVWYRPRGEPQPEARP